MAETRDLEKLQAAMYLGDDDGDRTPVADTSSSTDEEEDDARHLDALKNHDRHVRGRSGSDSSDPLEALAHALTPDQATPAEHQAGGSRASLSLRDSHRGNISRTRTGTSIGGASSIASRPPDFEVVFEPGDAQNPKNWPLWYRVWVVFVVSYACFVVVFFSSSYASSIPGLQAEFGVSNESVVTLGITTYLVGLAVGSLVVAPMSELFGRRKVYLVCQAIATVLVLPCAMATSLSEILVVRFFVALFGSAAVSNSPGSIVDIASEEYRALYMSLWSIAPMNGPTIGPIVGGFVYEYLGWRWDNWLVMIMYGSSVLLLFTMRETYAPSVLKAKAARIRKETGDERWWCRYEQRIPTRELFKINLSRPFILFFTEPILWFFNLWISIIYAILYLCFVAYPIVFSEGRGWGPGTSGLAFLGIGIGAMLAIVTEPLWRYIINSRPKDPATGRAPPEATAIVMLIGAILTPLGQLVFSWTCLPASIPWAIPIAFGIPFGMGNVLSFIYGANYLAGAYGIYAASALAGNAVIRSAFGGTLPLAGPAMYRTLTPQWAGTLLGLLEVCMVPIPFVFYRYGVQIRARSPVIRQMREDMARNETGRNGGGRRGGGGERPPVSSAAEKKIGGEGPAAERGGGGALEKEIGTEAPEGRRSSSLHERPSGNRDVEKESIA